MDDLSFGKLVREQRELLLLTQEQLAERASLSVRSVRAMESGEVQSPRAHSVVLLSEALRLSGAQRATFEVASRARVSRSRPEPSSDRPVGTSPGWALPTSLLPPDIADFTGYGSLVGRLIGLLSDGVREPSATTPTAVLMSVIAGRAGIGKTTLALHVAHRLRGRFPDGQLYVNLRGAYPNPLEPSEVLARFLRALGVDGAAIPSGLQEREECYRGLLAGRQVLVVLDDAAGEAQVRPLLPGSSTCAVLVTSRARLAALEGAQLVELGVLEPAQAVALLARIAGEQRVRAQSDAAAAIVKWCGLLPLAVRIAGAKLAARPHWPLTRLEGLLADESLRLDQLTVGDLEVRASVALSYDALADQDRGAFRRLALLDAPDFAGWVAAAVLDVGAGQGEDVVERLVQAQLLDVAGDGDDGQPRYRFHDLLRVYGRERAHLEEPQQQRDDALQRALGAWLALAERADELLLTGSAVLSRGIAPRWRLDGTKQSALLADPLAWLDTEHFALLAAVKQASSSPTARMDDLAWEIAASLASFFELRSYFDEWRSTNTLALATTRRTGNRRGQIAAVINLAESQLEHDRPREAAHLLEEAQRLALEAGDEHAYAYTLFKLATAERFYRGRLLVALRLADRAVDMFTRLGGGRHLGYSLIERGTVHLVLGRDIQAEADLNDAMSLVADRDQRAQAQALRRLAMLQMDRGELHLAVQQLERGLELCRTVQDTLGEAYLLETLGRFHLKRADFVQALALLDKAYDLFQRIGVLRGQGMTQVTIGELHAAQGRPAQALAYLRQAMEIWELLGMSHELERTEQLHNQFGRAAEVSPRRSGHRQPAHQPNLLGQA